MGPLRNATGALHKADAPTFQPAEANDLATSPIFDDLKLFAAVVLDRFASGLTKSFFAIQTQSLSKLELFIVTVVLALVRG
jgi:hypothetical protein